MIDTLRQWLGIELRKVDAREKVLSALGGAIAILVVVAVSRDALGSTGAATLIGSMGASAVLLFAVPHGALSQPWAVIGGHILSALIGVTVARYWDDSTLAAGVAVGLAIGVMYQFRCIHPPGGATALAAVIGGEQVHDLGYEFVLRPVIINAATILLVAVLFNAFFPWRRYPAHLARRPVPTGLGQLPPSAYDVHLSQDHILSALRSFNSFVDIREDDLRYLIRILESNMSPRDPSAGPPGGAGGPPPGTTAVITPERATTESAQWSPPRGRGFGPTPPQR